MWRAGTGGTQSRWLLVVVLAIAILLLIFAERGESAPVAPEPVTLRTTFASFPDHMDPQLSYTAEGWTAMDATYIPLPTPRHANGKAGADVAQERRYAALDRSYMKLAPWAPYGTRTLSTFVSKRVDLGKVVFNPTLGADLASFQLK